MATVTIVSNGHGEDVIGASLAQALLRRRPELRLSAFPLVDDGAAYRRLDLPRLGPCRILPSGGLTMHARSALVADLRAGFVGMTLEQLSQLARLRSDVLLVVGDIYAQALAAFGRARLRAVVQPLVSVHHRGDGAPPAHRYFMERISYPERALMRQLATVVYARDEATARWLRRHGVPRAVALGNPMVDLALGRALPGLERRTTLALLPGTRAHSAAALQRMAEAVALAPGVTGVVAWSAGALPALPGWREDRSAAPLAGRTVALRRGASRLWVVEGRFGDVLASARAALGTGGTANEQAAARGVPVVSFPVEPGYGRRFLANQQRLLGGALTVVPPAAEAVAAAARALLADEERWALAARAGRQRMGPEGGSERIAEDLLARLDGSGPG